MNYMNRKLKNLELDLGLWWKEQKKWWISGVNKLSSWEGEENNKFIILPLPKFMICAQTLFERKKISKTLF